MVTEVPDQLYLKGGEEATSEHKTAVPVLKVQGNRLVLIIIVPPTSTTAAHQGQWNLTNRTTKTLFSASSDSVSR